MNRRRLFLSTCSLLLGATALAATVVSAQTASTTPVTPANNTRSRWDPLPQPPAGAPNILLIMTDDVGFAASSTFGGPVPTPNLDRLAHEGVLYNNFHTTAMCSPTRAALLTGRNPHTVGFGAIADMAMGYSGYNTEIPAATRTVAEILKRGGYATSMFGKLHLTPNWERELSGPHKQWPTDLGFDYFYGFIAADSDQWHPTLIRGTNLVDSSNRPADLILDQDMANDAIHWLHQAKADFPDKPFFTYFSTGSAHAPQQAPQEWIAKFKGKFDQGWDKLRAEIVARQKQMGIVPPRTDVTARPAQLPAWESLTPEQKRLDARYMEVFAAQLAFQDAQVGRLLDELSRMGQRDNTIVMFIEGDNGASAEGGVEGSLNELRKLSQVQANYSDAERADLDRLGGPDSYEIYPAGWAWATNSPFPFFKQVASHLGGTRNGMVISWPSGIKDDGRVVNRFQYVTDIAPTLLSISGIPAPANIDGVTQRPFDGVSLADSLLNPNPVQPPRTQYFEILGNRALYKDGWWANTVPARMPWEAKSPLPAEQFKWELYDLRRDFAQAHDVSTQYPQKLAEMQMLWDEEARRNNVYPLRAELDVQEIARLSRPLPKRNDFVFWGTDVHLPWTTQPNLARSAFTITAEFSFTGKDDRSGVLMATGSSMGGWSLQLEDGRPVLNHIATEAAADHYRIGAQEALAPGDHELVARFVPDDQRIGSGGTLTISVDGRVMADGRIAHRALNVAGSNELFDVGRDTGAPVMPGLVGEGVFKGTLRKLVVHLGD